MSEDPKKTGDDESISRRSFFYMIGLGAMGVTVGGSTVLSLQYLSPNVVLEPPSRFKVGRPEDFPPGTVRLDTKRKVYIIRDQQGQFYALSAVCTHLGCITGWKESEGKISCPCHGSSFDRHGEVLGGPAPRPLPHFAIELTDRGELIVDKSEVTPREKVLKV